MREGGLRSSLHGSVDVFLRSESAFWLTDSLKKGLRGTGTPPRRLDARLARVSGRASQGDF